MLKSKIAPVFLLVFVVLTFWCVKSLNEPTFFTQVTGKRKFADSILLFTIGVVIPFIYLNIDALDKVLLKPFKERKEHIYLHSTLNRWSYVIAIVGCLLLLV